MLIYYCSCKMLKISDGIIIGIVMFPSNFVTTRPKKYIPSHYVPSLCLMCLFLKTMQKINKLVRVCAAVPYSMLFRNGCFFVSCCFSPLFCLYLSVFIPHSSFVWLFHSIHVFLLFLLLLPLPCYHQRIVYASAPFSHRKIKETHIFVPTTLKIFENWIKQLSKIR